MRRVIKPANPHRVTDLSRGKFPDPWELPKVKTRHKVILGLFTAGVTAIYLALAGGIIWVIVELIKWIQRH